MDLRLAHKWVVAASDGLWDVFQNQVFNFIKKLVDLVKSRESALEIAEELVRTAKVSGSNDNISVIVLKLN